MPARIFLSSPKGRPAVGDTVRAEPSGAGRLWAKYSSKLAQGRAGPRGRLTASAKRQARARRAEAADASCYAM